NREHATDYLRRALTLNLHFHPTQAETAARRLKGVGGQLEAGGRPEEREPGRLGKFCWGGGHRVSGLLGKGSLWAPQRRACRRPCSLCGKGEIEEHGHLSIDCGGADVADSSRSRGDKPQDRFLRGQHIGWGDAVEVLRIPVCV